MVLKDKAVRWYLQNIEMPGREMQDNPGFMGENLAERDFYLRDIALPEQVFVDVENRIDEPEILYSVGKKFGYRYTKNSGFKQLPEVSRKKFKRTVYLIMRYFESVSYWRRGDQKLDQDNKIWRLQVDDFIVCRRNGKGHIFLGAAAGLWSYLIDEEAEAAQTECQGRGDDRCSLVLGPPENLEENLKFLHHDLEEEDINLSQDYPEFNQIRDTEYVENSFKDFKEIGFFEYRDGLFYQGDERYIWTEASLVHLLGSELDSYREELFGAAFEYGQELADQESDRKMKKFVTEYLSACGWGDTFIKQQSDKFVVRTHLFPWTRFWRETSFPLYRGLVSGLLTGFNDREVRLEKVEKDTKGQGFTVMASED